MLPPRVFLSYSHDSPQHENEVRDLADRLRRDGLDAVIDRYHPAPPNGWPMWMDAEIQKADFVILVCTPAYLRRVERREQPGVGRGVLWEATLIYNHLYVTDAAVQKFIPVLLVNGAPADIPWPLRGFTFYQAHTPEGYEELLQHLSGKARREEPELGKLVDSAAMATKASESLRNIDDEPVSLGEIAKAFQGDVPKPWDPIEGLKTGYTEFDQLTLGLHPGELTLIAAGLAVGGTTFALNIATNVALEQRKPVMLFSLEMPKLNLLQRVLAGIARVDFHRLRSGYIGDDDLKRLNNALAAIEGVPLFIDDDAATDLRSIESQMTRVQAKGPLGLVVVATLQELVSSHTAAAGREVRPGFLCQGLKTLAKRFHCPILLVSFLGGKPARRGSGFRPLLKDLGDSGAVEKACDCVAFLFREDMYKPEPRETTWITEVIVDKQRHGPVGSIKLFYNIAITRFENLNCD